MFWIHRDTYYKMAALMLIAIMSIAVVVSVKRPSPEAEAAREVVSDEEGKGSQRLAAPRGLAYFLPWDGHACVSTSGLHYSLINGIAVTDGYSVPPQEFAETLNQQQSTKPPPSPVPDKPVEPMRIYRGNEERPRVALTFDSNTVPEPQAGRLINILIQEGIPATLFVCGSWAYANPEYLRTATDAGFEIASHSFWHPYMTRILPQHVVGELVATSEAVAQVSGKPISAYFRPPFGDVNAGLVDLAASCGYYTVMWTRDTRDWDIATTPDDIIRRATEGVQNGDIILMHMGGIHTLEVLPHVAHLLRSKGFELTTVTGVMEP